MISSSRILIVEDDPALLRGLSDNFQVAGYQVETASDGKIGLAKVLASPPDLLLLDIMLPLLNGYEICQQVRQAKHEFPIIMLSAKGQEQEIVRGLELGADDYMTKPFGILELMARVKRLVKQNSIDHAKPITIGKAILDRESHTLTREGELISLTTKEYRLLDYFVSNRHRALTRSDIINKVWGSSIIVSTRSVDRCVATLRSKIEEEPAKPKFIHTIRDIGYRFELDG